MRNRTVIAIVTGTLAAVAVTGTALAANRDEDPAASPSASASLGPAESASPTPSESAASAVPASRAGAIALAAAGGGTVVNVGRETEHGRAVYRIRIMNGATRHDLKVDQLTGAVVDHDTRIDASTRDRTPSTGTDDHGGRRDRDQRVESGDDRGSGR